MPSPSFLPLRALHWPTQPEARGPRNTVDGVHTDEPLGALSRKREHSRPRWTMEDAQPTIIIQ